MPKHLLSRAGATSLAPLSSSTARPSRVRLVAGLLAAPLLAMASGAAYALDLQVNHSILLYQGAGVAGPNNPQDGPVGGAYTYRTSSGINDATGTVSGAQLRQELPADAIFQGIAHPAGVSCSGQPAIGQPIGAAIIECILPTLQAGSGNEVQVDFNVILPTKSISNKAYASLTAAGNPDGNPINHDRVMRDITTHERADLAVEVTSPADGSSFQSGSVVNYTLQASNADSTYAFPLAVGEKAVVRFPLPAGTEWHGDPSGTGWTCEQALDNSASPPVSVQTCTYTAVTAIAKGQDLPLLTVPVRVTSQTGHSDVAVSVQGLTAGNAPFIDADPDNNLDEVRIHFTANTQMDMVLAKAVAPTTLDKNGASTQKVTYTLTATRSPGGGLQPSGEIYITDSLPANVTFDAVTAGSADAGWTCANVTTPSPALKCDFTGTVNEDGSLPPLVFTADVAVDSVAIDASTGIAERNNTATLYVENEPLANTGNNTNSAKITVRNRPNLTSAKSARVANTDGTVGSALTGAVKDGSEFFWRVAVRNGASNSVNVLANERITVTDVLDPNLEYVSYSATGTGAPWTCSVTPAPWTNPNPGPAVPQTVTCYTDAGIPTGSTANLDLKVKAHIPAGEEWASISNTAGVTCSAARNCAPSIQAGPTTVNLSEKVADLSISKEAVVTGASAPDLTTGDSGDEVVYTLKFKNAVPNPMPAGMTGADFQTAQTVEVTDVVTDLLNNNAVAGNHPVTGTPRYANNRFVQATVEDVLGFPSGMTSEGCTYTPVQNSTTATTVKCTLKNVPVSDTEYTVTIKARQFVHPTSNADQTRKITNEATVGSPDTAEHDAGNNRDDAEVTLTALTNLVATKTASSPTVTSGDPVAAGAPVTYTLRVENQGPSRATSVRVVDTLPVGMIWVTAPNMPTSGDNSGSCSLSGGGTFDAGEVVTEATQTMTCTWANAAPVGTRTLTYTLRSANTGYPASVRNEAQVETETPETIPLTDPNTDNKTDQTITLDEPRLDVRITMEHTADRLPINQGAASRTEYTIKVINSGASASYATNVVMRDLFPAPGSTANFTLNGATVTGVRAIGTNGQPLTPNRFGAGNCAFTSNPDGLQCNFPWLAPGESAEITFEMDATGIDNNGLPYGTILHDASVSADGEHMPNLPPGQTVQDNNTVTDRTSAYDASGGFDPDQLRLVDLAIEKTSSTTGTQVGGQIAYRLRVTNVETATPPNHLVNGNAKVTDVLPAGLALVGTPPSGCSYDAQTRTLECTITNLNQGASVDFDFTVQVNALAPGQTRVVNRATIHSPGDPNKRNDEDEEEVPSTPPPAAAIPTLSEWGLIILSLMMVGFGLRRVPLQASRRKSRF